MSDVDEGGRGRAPAAPGSLIQLLVLALGVWIAYEAWNWPDVATLARRTPKTTAFIDRYRERQRDAGRDARVAWTSVPYAAISPHLKRAVVVAEDVNFFSHHGFDTGEMRQAVMQALEDVELPRGASTITQQLAKNLWLSPSRNPVRKLKEAVFTWQLERSLGKRRILELYLNVVEFGPGVFGVEAASRRYFGKSAVELSEEEAVALAASLPNPTAWHPGSSSPPYRRRVEAIRRRMAKAEFLWKQIGAPFEYLPKMAQEVPVALPAQDDPLVRDLCGGRTRGGIVRGA
ncbi:MAG: monofunctional biosynthetic peptidoglycan transglycosylase [Candidatus Rokubacteria bacterium 13_1_40CM_69_27]|nr:MAG: monofunctional biosynthetic peptidoglycan transglycosylase [Candidatus Rokubacteria bacterium 13_1_40CM_69_27]OLC35792.1 MAG: monofunctional biosynthetic peptidoglycan transglycosylase [Candidatus Rokubacteria bacterium 13_1_40CM_4_69_5]OLE39511.1 MAG: monofunctional biosynthetic peptidoglycan transglycosylase [Candidatus Rokubacteria bacterium 13_1_20CM_2_70_7]